MNTGNVFRKWCEQKTDAKFLALREFSRCNVLDLLCLLLCYLLVWNEYKDYVICVIDDCKDMKKVKSKHEKDSEMDVAQTTCRSRPCAVNGEFDAGVAKSSKDGVVYQGCHFPDNMKFPDIFLTFPDQD